MMTCIIRCPSSTRRVRTVTRFPSPSHIIRTVEQDRAPVTWRDIGPDSTKVGLI